MKAIIQRVSKANVEIEGKIYDEINNGILVLLGIKKGDGDAEIEKMAKKITNLRIFDDSDGKMNLSIQDVQGEILVISNFTLYGDTKKGNRPSYVEAEKPNIAETIYNDFVSYLRKMFKHKVAEGKFQENMQISLINNGPVTLIIEV